MVLKGRQGVSTGALFSQLRPPYQELDHEGMLDALARGDLAKVGRCMQNGLEEQASAMAPEIAQLKKLLLEQGALGACMTGSGSAVIGLFPDAVTVDSFIFNFKSNCDRFSWGDVW